VVAIAALRYATLALRSDGTIVDWGCNAYDQLAFPGDLTNAMAISAFDYTTAVLRNNGTVAFSSGSSPNWAPADLSNAVSVAAGDLHAVALRSDGSIVTWGNNGHGQCTFSNDVRAAAIASGAYFSIALLRMDPTKADTDGDGMPDGWEIANGLDPTRAGDELRDDDNDGLDNAAEYALGGKARVPDLGLGIAICSASDGTHFFSWPSFPGISDYLVTLAWNGAVAFSNTVTATELSFAAAPSSSANGTITVTALANGRRAGQMTETWPQPPAGSDLTLWKIARDSVATSNAYVTGTLLLNRTLEIDRQGIWDRFLVSASPNQPQAWNLQGARLELDGQRVQPPPANSCWQMPSPTNDAVTMNTRIVSEATNGMMSVSGPIYLLKWSPNCTVSFED